MFDIVFSNFCQTQKVDYAYDGVLDGDSRLHRISDLFEIELVSA